MTGTVFINIKCLVHAKSFEQKPLKDANFLSVHVYVCIDHMFKRQKMAGVQIPCRVNIGHLRAEINGAAVVDLLITSGLANFQVIFVAKKIS